MFLLWYKNKIKNASSGGAFLYYKKITEILQNDWFYVKIVIELDNPLGRIYNENVT